VVTLNDAVELELRKEIAINEWQNMVFYIEGDRLWIFLNGHDIIVPKGFPPSPSAL
jgi:hypothetical protein